MNLPPSNAPRFGVNSSMPAKQNLKLVTKVGARRDDAGGVHPAQRPEELKEGVEANLRSLQVERLDLVNLRLVGTTNGSVVPLEEQLGALEELRQAGKLDNVAPGDPEVSETDLASFLHGDKTPPPITDP